jgi:hypothetical protein
VVFVVGLMVVQELSSVAQVQVRQPTRQVQPQVQSRVRPRGTDDQPARLNREQTRRVQGGPDSGAAPTIDQRTGQVRSQRQVIRPGWRLPVRPAPRWRLGVDVDNAPLGLRITQVARNSPAQRFGLERGDYILDVMGYPVGFHRNAYSPIAEAFNQLVRRDGWVNVLIWNRRTNAEEAMWIQLEPRGGRGGIVRPFGAQGGRSVEN